MRTALFTALVAGLMLAAFGCARGAPVVGHAVTQEGTYYGDLGITGNGSKITVLRGSRVNKLSIIGNNCTVMVEDGAGLAKIEFWGNGNVVSIPDTLIVRSNTVGTNQIIRRPRPATPVLSDPYALPPPSPATPAPTSMEPVPAPGLEPRPTTPPAGSSGTGESLE